MASSPFTASPEDDVAAFIIDKTALPACMRICWGGGGVEEAPITDTSLADGLFWPSPSSGICTTGATGWRGGRAGIPSFLMVSIASAMVRECVFCDGRSYSRRVYKSMVQRSGDKTHKSFAKRQEKSRVMTT